MKDVRERIVMIIGVVIAVVAIFLCGCIVGPHIFNKVKDEVKENKKSAKAEDALDIDTSEYGKYSEYIELGDFKTIKVNKAVPTVDDVDEETVSDALEYYLSEYEEYKDITKRGIKKGDYINIDFTGVVEGVEDENASSEDYDLVAGEGEFFDEFEEALIGLEVGSTTALPMTFPEDYGDEDYNGKEVVFTVTVNSIQKLTYKPELTDEFVKENIDGCETVEEWTEVVRQEELQYLVDDAEETVLSDVYDKALELTKLVNYEELIEKYPEVHDDAYSMVVADYEESADMFSMTFEEYLEFLEMTEEDLEEEVQLTVKSNLMLEQIIKDEGLTITQADVDEYVEAYYYEYDFETADEFVEYYGEDQIQEVCLMEKCYDVLLEKAQITEVTVEEYDALLEEEE